MIIYFALNCAKRWESEEVGCGSCSFVVPFSQTTHTLMDMSSTLAALLSIQRSLPTLQIITAIQRKSHTHSHTHGLVPLSHVAEKRRKEKSVHCFPTARPDFGLQGAHFLLPSSVHLCDLFFLLDTHSLALTRHLLIASANSESFHLLKQTETMRAVGPCFSTETHRPHLSLSLSLPLPPPLSLPASLS